MKSRQFVVAPLSTRPARGRDSQEGYHNFSVSMLDSQLFPFDEIEE